MNFTCMRIQLLALRRRGGASSPALVGQNIRSGDVALDAAGIVLGDPDLDQVMPDAVAVRDGPLAGRVKLKGHSPSW
jgi:hypothetical protein